MTYAELGSVSEGTLRDCDLLDSFAFDLELLTRQSIDAHDCNSATAQANFLLCASCADHNIRNRQGEYHGASL